MIPFRMTILKVSLYKLYKPLLLIHTYRQPVCVCVSCADYMTLWSLHIHVVHYPPSFYMFLEIKRYFEMDSIIKQIV